MRAAIVLSVLAIIPAFVVSTPDEEGTEAPLSTVSVEIFYEALCPDSQKFFNEQFQPNIGLILDSQVYVTLTPYGKMTHVVDNTGAWKSQCRHTERECEGHRVQACALRYMSPPAAIYRYIACLMKRGQKQKPYPGKECADYIKKDFPQIQYGPTEECANGAEADQELEVLRERTEALQPNLKSVPVIVFNNVFNQEDQDLALKNFKQLLCKYLSANSQDLETCATHSSAAGHTVTLTLVLSALAALLIARF